MQNGRQTTAMRRLESLDDQFDFADAAASEFHVSIALPTGQNLLVDARFHLANLAEDAGIKQRRVYIRSGHLEKPTSQIPASGDRPGLQQGQAFPRSQTRTVIPLVTVQAF